MVKRDAVVVRCCQRVADKIFPRPGGKRKDKHAPQNLRLRPIENARAAGAAVGKGDQQSGV